MFVFDTEKGKMEKYPDIQEFEEHQIHVIIEKFISWLNNIQHEIESVDELLSNRLSPEPEALISDLQDAEIWNARISSLLADANGWLDRASYTLKPSRQEGTELWTDV